MNVPRVKILAQSGYGKGVNDPIFEQHHPESNINAHLNQLSQDTDQV